MATTEKAGFLESFDMFIALRAGLAGEVTTKPTAQPVLRFIFGGVLGVFPCLITRKVWKSLNSSSKWFSDWLLSHANAYRTQLFAYCLTDTGLTGLRALERL